MNYKEEILETENKLNNLKNNRDKFQQLLKTLKVGDVVYEEQARFLDYDYHPQIIKEIDIDNCKVLTYEESIKAEKWVTCFHLYNKETRKFDFHY
jgi:hypothetical protein